MKRIVIALFVSLLVLSACGQKIESKNVIEGFKKVGLIVKKEKKMTHEDFGPAPYKTKDARIFNIEGDKNARVFVFDNDSDLKDTKKYYDKLGEESAMFYSHTYAKDKVLIQMNGEIKESLFKKYTKTIDKVVNGEKITKFKTDKKKEVTKKEKTKKKDNEESTVSKSSESTSDEEVVNEQPSTEQNNSTEEQQSVQPKQEGISQKEYDNNKTTTHDESQMSNPEYEQYKQAQKFTQEFEQGQHQNGVGGGPGMTSPSGESFNDYQNRVQQERDALTPK